MLQFSSAECAKCKFEVAEPQNPELWLTNILRLPQLKYEDYSAGQKISTEGLSMSFPQWAVKVFNSSSNETDNCGTERQILNFLFILNKYKLYLTFLGGDITVLT